MAGGTAWYGVPDYHLPKDVLLDEIEKIRLMGVDIRTHVTIGKDITLEQLIEENDAVLITTGCKDARSLDVPGSNLMGILSGYEFLETVFSNGLEKYLKKPKYNLGKNILVIGGGDTSLDCARTALRLTEGKGNVTVICLHPQTELHVDPIMLQEAEEEGIKFEFLVQVKSIQGNLKGHVTHAIVNRMQMGDLNDSGRRHPVVVPNKEFTMNCSTLLIAIGRGPNSFLQKKAGIGTGERNSIVITNNFNTSLKGVFAAGDVTSGETLIVKAMEKGREAAQRVHEYLMNLESNHVSFYEKYYTDLSYDKMLKGKQISGSPPD
jgi:glutamate synthase (NADPH/NADH) small chain